VAEGQDKAADSYEVYGLPEIIVGSADDPALQSGQEDAFFKVEFEEAREAEGWMGISQDLRFVVKATRHLADVMRQQGEGSGGTPVTLDTNDTVVISLWTAALVAYARCFATGVRARLSEGVFDDKSVALEEHRYYMDLRNKHVVHSVNPFEISATGVGVANVAGEDPYVYGAVGVHLTRTGEPFWRVEHLGDLADRLQHYAYSKHRDRSTERLCARSAPRLRRCPANNFDGFPHCRGSLRWGTKLREFPGQLDRALPVRALWAPSARAGTLRWRSSWCGKERYSCTGTASSGCGCRRAVT
jgi:hypothetical protein